MKQLLSFILLALISISPLPAFAAAEPGQPAPDFSVTDIAGQPVKLADLKGKYVVLEWTNHLCPFVKKHYESGNMQKLQEKYTGEGVVWVSIISSAKDKEGFVSDEEAAKIAKERNSHATHIVRDPEGTLGRLYGAKTTPHMFVIDKDGKLAYAGAIDNIPTFDKADLAKAENYIDRTFNELKAGKLVSTASTRSYGCGVKYGD